MSEREPSASAAGEGGRPEPVEPRVRVEGRMVPLLEADIDTDRILPARFTKTVRFDGLGRHALADDRSQCRAEGGLHPLDDPRFAEARILLAGPNFGCGSSREHAVHALRYWGRGIQGIIGTSYSTIFFGNCVANGIPAVRVTPEALAELARACTEHPETVVQIDVERREIRCGARLYPLEIVDSARQLLCAGTWDAPTLLRSRRTRIAEVAAALPYFRGWTDEVDPA